MTLVPGQKLADILPDLKAWNDGGGISPEGWLSTFGSVPHALAYSAIFWPTFVKYRGCLLWEGFSPESFDNWMTRLNGDKTAAESIINHRHITDFFLNAEEEPTEEQIAYLGLLLRDIWLVKLHRDFPDLEVQVEFSWLDREANEDAQLFVYCQR